MLIVPNIFATVVLLLAIFADGKQFRCDYKYFPDAEGWLKLHRVPANWFEARLRCHLEGGKLASPLNKGLQNAMKTLIDGATGDMTCGVFTGIHALFSKGDFHSIEGVPLSQIPHAWTTGEPDNYKDKESCIALLPDGNIADVDCHEPLPYICYVKDTHTMVVSTCGTTDREYAFEPSTGSCYKFHTVPRTWSRAYMTCAAEGGHLVIINSEQEAKVVKDLYAKYPPNSLHGINRPEETYVGFHDWNEHGEWLTIHGETLAEAGYAQWKPAEPNNLTIAGGEFCGSIKRTALLNDLDCWRTYTFICEKSPDSLLCKS